MKAIFCAPNPGWRVVVMFLLGCLLLCQCAQKPASAARAEWYVASKSPLTYCPRGHQLPPPEKHGAEYVYLADRKTRFHIPMGCLTHRQQALELRRLSTAQGNANGGEFTLSVGDTMDWVKRAVYRTAVTGVVAVAMCVGGPPQEGSIADELLASAWDE